MAKFFNSYTFVTCQDNGVCFYNGACSAMYSVLPSLTFQFFDDNLWIIPPSAYTMAGVDSEGGKVCVLMVQGRATLKSFKYIIGNTFL